MFRLNPLTIVVAGLMVILIIWAGFFFLRINPARQELAYWTEQNEKLDRIISPDSRRAAVERVRLALERVRDAEVEWKQVVERRTPSAGQMSLVPDRWQLTVNARRWHGIVENDLRRWVQRSAVRLVEPAGGPFVPYPTDHPNELVEFYFNYPALPFPIAFWDLGTLTVEGSYEQIVNHVRSWSRIPNYIASVRGLSITGTGTRLRGTYGLMVIAYINTEFVSGGPAAGGGVPHIGTGAGAQAGSGIAPRGGVPGATAGPGGGMATGVGGGGGGGGAMEVGALPVPGG